MLSESQWRHIGNCRHCNSPLFRYGPKHSLTRLYKWDDKGFECEHELTLMPEELNYDLERRNARYKEEKKVVL